jgi:hypothetical protein
MPSTDRKLELKAKDIDGSDRLAAGCVLTDLASPAVWRTTAYAKGLNAAYEHVSKSFQTCNWLTQNLWISKSGLEGTSWYLQFGIPSWNYKWKEHIDVVEVRRSGHLNVACGF